MARFHVGTWLGLGCPPLDSGALQAGRPLDFEGVTRLEPAPLSALVGAIGVTSADELLDEEWVVPEELSLPLQEQLQRAADGTDQAMQQLAAMEPPGGESSDFAIHPIEVVDGVLEEYRSYLVTEFRARDEKLREELERQLNSPLFLAQEPFFQSHRPFKEGGRWRDLGLDGKLAATMEAWTGVKRAYLHQSEAIENLLRADAPHTVVTTGTGSGKTECFLLPVIQNAIEDAARFKQPGMTAILIYPMNALANDQEARIQHYLESSGHTYVKVARYDRLTTLEQRRELRKNPPHILLTNYMMLEYLLVRPADREDLFANHRCRFLVLDEVHTYRGNLGANIALLVRRLRAHLGIARQDWGAGDPSDPHRFPELATVATSATIKSLDEEGLPAEEVRRLRDEAVQKFVGRLTGFEPSSFLILGEELVDLEPPAEARWAANPSMVESPDIRDPESVRRTVIQLSDASEDARLESASGQAKVLWFLNDLLARRPLPLPQIVTEVCSEVPERKGADRKDVEKEVRAALVAGSTLPGRTPGALRLRTHRFLRGGWHFHRCIDPACGRLYPMGEENCTCGRPTAPLLLCRSCGADALHLCGSENPEEGALEAYTRGSDASEWILYDAERLTLAWAEGDDSAEKIRQMKQRPVLTGSFDHQTGAFSTIRDIYPLQVGLAPARNRCLVCGFSAGPGSILTPVALGTSAAVRVVTEGLVEGLHEQNQQKPKHDGKERILIFADSRQDAAHQARFITFAGRYDRMRRRLLGLLEEKKTLSLEGAIKELMAKGLGDNPHALNLKDPDFIPQAVQARAQAWEEAPLLDDFAVRAGYRATILNLGLAGVGYERLGEYLSKNGEAVGKSLGLTSAQLEYLCRCLLDEFRVRGAVSRPMLRYHTMNPSCPDEFKEAADWERRRSQPAGYPCTQDADPQPQGRMRLEEVEEGINLQNAWRKPGGKGRPPRMEKKFRQLLKGLGGDEPTEEGLLSVFDLLAPFYLAPSKLFGYRKATTLLQLNAEAVQLELLGADDRYRCKICSFKMAKAIEEAPCPLCHGRLEPWPEKEVNASRYVRRIRKAAYQSLVAGEHTAQVTGAQRLELEEAFKGSPQKSPVNVLACSPTLELGIDVGGLDAVMMRNVPPRPDNYAQRGGRAGRRSRVGIVLSYARSRPHDAYFYDRPQEMIAGEVPAPSFGLGNRDVVIRHLNAIALGASDPGIHGKMGEYITLQGEVVEEEVEDLVKGFEAQIDHAVRLALKAWGPEVLEPAGLADELSLREALAAQPERITDLFDRVRRQVMQLRETIKIWTELGRGDRQALSAMELIRRLLGQRGERSKFDADDRTAGYPLRRFAEFGILPGYEFPSEPATIRLIGDKHEEEPIAVERRFGITQYAPEARAYARGHRWRVVGLDAASPWNPKSDAPGWLYLLCPGCGLRYGAQDHVVCPRCGSTEGMNGKALPGYEFGGFVAVRDDTPVLEEEDRFAMASLVVCNPQWNGRVTARYSLPIGWQTEVGAEEDVRWLNEWKAPSAAEFKRGVPILHQKARGFYLCQSCGRMLKPPEDGDSGTGKRRKPRKRGADSFGHAQGCARLGQPPTPLALVARTSASTLRIIADLPSGFGQEDYQIWGQSLGFALRMGIRHRYMLDGPEIEFNLESAWEISDELGKGRRGCLTFIDPAIGGSGFLDRAAEELHLVASRAIEHLDHSNCDSACYRCLKSYANQRFHQHLNWPMVMPDLESLAAGTPESVPLKMGDAHDPRPWLDAFDAGVGSPLELKFLRLFEGHGLAVEKQVPVSDETEGQPISVADFAVTGSKVLIYIDSAAFHQGQRLRRDRAIRKRLREGSLGWDVVELRAKDLKRGAELVEGLKERAP